MVQLLLEQLERDPEVEVHHVDCRVSTGLEDIGSMRFGKIGLMFKYCLEAIWLRLRHGVRNFYFVPATPNRAPLYRDWIVMALCRPFFRNIIYHWHAVGLGEWLRKDARPWERQVSERLIYRPTLSMVLGEYNRRDAEQLQSKRIAIVPNGIPDPCPEFEKEILPLRLARPEDRPFKALFLSLCYSEKGLFDAIEAIAVANQKQPLKLTVAGTFYREAEKKQFEHRIAQPDLKGLVDYKGFVSGEMKKQLMREHDCMCFPTWYSAESFGLVLVEAMAYGMHCVTTRWRTIPELLPEGYDGLVDPRSPRQLAAALSNAARKTYDARLRARFLEHYTDKQFAAKIKAALKGL